MSEDDKKPSRSAGPQGLGDPNDRSLRKLEKDVLIEKMMRDIARTEKCVEVTEALEKCGREQSWKSIFNCRKENDAMQECMGYWYYNKAFREEVTEQYLKERSQFRQTGISKKMKKELEDMGYEIHIKS